MRDRQMAELNPREESTGIAVRSVEHHPRGTIKLDIRMSLLK